MKHELELLKEVKEKTLEKIIDKFGNGYGELSKMKLSIIDVRDILYSQVKEIAEREFSKDRNNEKNKFEGAFN